MKPCLSGVGLAIFLSSRMAGQTPPPSTMPGLNLSLPDLNAQYNHYGVGKRLKPKQWPNGARVAVALSFDIDNVTVPLSRGQLGSEDLSRGMYGAVDGLPRILRLLDRQNVPASFFIPAVSAALNPEMIPLIQSHHRHEIGVHGWIHEHLGKFLHGNPVHTALLSPASARVGWFWLAPSLYRLALTGFLDLSFKKRIPNLKNPQKLGEYAAQKMEFTDYQAIIERALLRARR
jgi:hypothetical protein